MAGCQRKVRSGGHKSRLCSARVMLVRLLCTSANPRSAPELCCEPAFPLFFRLLGRLNGKPPSC
eukprot:508586-Pyramimonas_sp.AAC.1